MSLPVVPLGRGTVIIGDEVIEYRALSRSEALRLNTYRGREDEAEVYIIQCGTGCTEDEAKAFRDGNDAPTAGLLIDGIIEISGLMGNSPKT